MFFQRPGFRAKKYKIANLWTVGRKVLTLLKVHVNYFPLTKLLFPSTAKAFPLFILSNLVREICKTSCLLDERRSSAWYGSLLSLTLQTALQCKRSFKTSVLNGLWSIIRNRTMPLASSVVGPTTSSFANLTLHIKTREASVSSGHLDTESKQMSGGYPMKHEAWVLICCLFHKKKPMVRTFCLFDRIFHYKGICSGSCD